MQALALIISLAVSDPAVNMEVLLLFRSFRRVVRLQPASDIPILEQIQIELNKFQMGNEIEVSLCPQFVPNKKNLYRLQRWCHKFDCYIDVSDISELSDGDRLTIERGEVLKAGVKVSACVCLKYLEM